MNVIPDCEARFIRMGTLAFFPWVAGVEIEAEEFALKPFELGKHPYPPTSPEQHHVDDILSTYYVTAQGQVTKATVLQLSGVALDADLSADQVSEVFLFGEILAMAGLSAREFFRDDYVNRDNFRLIVQRFQPDRKGIAIVSRRRDGSTAAGWFEGSFRAIRPAHVPVVNTWELDKPLVRALLRARATTEWDRIYDAIVSYGRANTDSGDVYQVDELVMLVGAFERLLGSGSGSDNLRDKLMARIMPSKLMAPATCPRKSSRDKETARFQKAPSVLVGWIEDFYALRGCVAHGKSEKVYPCIWSLREHLLLGSFLFPLALKRELEVLGIYTPDETLQVDIDTFEPLACEDLFKETEPGETYPWNKARSHVSLAVRRFRARRGLKADGAAKAET